MSTTENRSQVFSQMKPEEILVLEQGQQNWLYMKTTDPDFNFTFPPQ